MTTDLSKRTIIIKIFLIVSNLSQSIWLIASSINHKFSFVCLNDYNSPHAFANVSQHGTDRRGGGGGGGGGRITVSLTIIFQP